MSLVKALKKWMDGRYIVTIPWKDNKDELQNNYSNVANRLAIADKKLSKDEQLARSYSGIFSQYLEKG